MQAHGIESGKGLQNTSERILREQFGKRGRTSRSWQWGEDTRQVTPYRERKSVGAERTHRNDIGDLEVIAERAVAEKQELMALAGRLLRRPRPPDEPVRLLGLSVSSLVGERGGGGRQLELDFP